MHKNAMRLVTIPLSHYCERARWALDRCGVSYREEQHLQMFHFAPVRRAGGRRTVPVLVTPEGPLTDSADIVAYADRHADSERSLYPEDETRRAEAHALESTYAGDFGVETRRWAYHRLLPHRRLVTEHNAGQAPLHERIALRLGFSLARGQISRYLEISDETAARARDLVQRTFDDVAERLADGRRYLTGDTFTAADLTFCALAAVTVFPPQYGGGQGGVRLPPREALPSALAQEIDALRSHPAGAFVLRLYREERTASPGG